MKSEPKPTHHIISRRAVLSILGTLALFAIAIIANEYRNRELVKTYNTRLAEVSSTTALLLSRLNESENRISEIVTRASAIEGMVLTEQGKSTQFEEQIGKVNSAVGTLDRLSKTDVQLLQKYSKVYFLNENYVPKSLSSINPEYLSEGKRELQMLTNVLPYLNKLMEASKQAGLQLKILSAYRSFNTQEDLKNSYKMMYGSTAANKFSADQGYSEHQLGTTLDFTTVKNGSYLDAFSSTAESKWLTDNAYQYGFILSYPLNNQYYQYEPWHWRFVGVDLANKLHREGKNFYDEDQRVLDNYLFIIFD